MNFGRCSWARSLAAVWLLILSGAALAAEGPLVEVQLVPGSTSLEEMLKQEFAKAAKVKRTPFVELTTPRCPPCMAIQKSLKDARMVDAFTGVYLIRLDVDVWKDKLGQRGFDAAVLPRFYLLSEAGNAEAQSITGDAWGEDDAENMAPPLKAFFRKNARVQRSK
jgi:hypothetical protein